MQLVKGAVPAGLLALVVYALLWLRAKPAGGAGAEGGPRLIDGLRRWAGPVVFTLAFIPTHLLVLDGAWPPKSAFDWLPVIAVAVLGLSVVLAWDGLPAAARWGVTAAALAGIGWVSSRNLIAQRWSGMETALHLAGFIGVSVIAAWSAMALVRGRPGPVPALLLMGPVVAGSQLLTIAYYSLRLGQAAGVTAAVLGGVVAVALWRRGLVLGPAAAAWAMLFTFAALYQGVAGEDYGLLMVYPAAVAAGLPLALLVRRVAGARVRGWVGAVLELAAAWGPGAAAVAVAASRRAAEGGF